MAHTTIDIISDAEIERVHANANFGATPKRQVVDRGVLTYAFGYSSGYTCFSILREHGLIRKNAGNTPRGALTKKGYRYLHALFRDVRLAEIEALRVREITP